MSDLKLFHQLADGFAAGPNDASVGPRVQMNILAHHLLQLCHQLLDGLTRLLHVTLITRDHDQILREEAEEWRIRRNVTRYITGNTINIEMDFICRTHTHLLLVSFVGELDADVVVFSDLRDDRSFAANNLGMKLGIYRHGNLETAQGLNRETNRVLN